MLKERCHIRFQMVSLRGQKKLDSHPHRSPFGRVYFKFSDEHYRFDPPYPYSRGYSLTKLLYTVTPNLAKAYSQHHSD